LYQRLAAIDDRDPWLDPPATLESMYCHYRQLAVAGPYQVLARTADRCSRPVAMEEARTAFGRPVAVPSYPGHLVAATLSLSLPLRSKVEAVLSKPPYLHITVSGRSGGATTYRFIPGTAADLQVLAVPASLAYSPAFTPPPITRFEISGGGWARGQGRITVKFYAVSFG